MEARRLTYPDVPGWKTERPETSRRAALAVAGRVAVLRERVLAEFDAGEWTADEVAERLGESVLSVRPRVSELAKADPPRLEDVGKRRRNASGHGAAVWRKVAAQRQEELWPAR